MTYCYKLTYFTFQLTANGLHGGLGKVVLSAVEEVQEREPEQNLLQLKKVEWIVLEIIKNFKNVVILIHALNNPLIASCQIGSGMKEDAQNHVEEVKKDGPDT